MNATSLLDPLWLSVQLAAVTTLLLILIGTPIAWWLAQSSSRWKPVVQTAVAMPIVLPPTVMGFYLLILLGPAGAGAWLATFHSTCVRILRRDIGHLGFSRGFAIYDQADSLGVVKEALRRHDLDPRVLEPRRLGWRIDQWKNAGITPSQAYDQAADFEMQRTAEVYTTYQRLLAEANALDFNDLLLRTTELFERFPDVLAHYRNRWQYVLIDEPARFVNHSCDSNTKAKDGCDVAVRDIKKGEEITADYVLEKVPVGFECRCGSEKCKGRIPG